MATNMYMSIGGMRGDSTEPGHVNEIELGACQFQERERSFTVSKWFDRASVPLSTALASGRHLGTVLVTFDYGGGTRAHFKSGLTFVASMQWDGEGSETVSFGYETLRSEYYAP